MSGVELYRAPRLPVLQNRTFRRQADACASPTGDVVLVQDDRTGLIHNASFDSSRVVYDSEYQNEQAFSPSFRRHLDDVARIIGTHFRSRSVIEIGCGQGYFLGHLRSAGFAVTGIDPAYQGSDPSVIKARFDASLGLSADGIVLRHVLEHIPDPLRFLRDVASANGNRGEIFIEVPCFDWIAAHRAWFDIFYEHVNYFRLADFCRIFDRVYEAGHVFGGQYLYVVADLASVSSDVAPTPDRVALPADFQTGIDRTVAAAAANRSGRNVVWGGASKGVIFSLYLQRAGVPIDRAIDINPAKQGRYLPLTGLRVWAPAEALPELRSDDTIYVMNANYLDEIIDATGNRFSYVTIDHEAV